MLLYACITIFFLGPHPFEVHACNNSRTVSIYFQNFTDNNSQG